MRTAVSKADKREQLRRKVDAMSDERVVSFSKEVGLATQNTEVNKTSVDNLRAMLYFMASL